MEPLKWKMVPSMKVNGKTTNRTDKAVNDGRTALNIEVISKTVRKMETEFSCLLMVGNIKVNFLMEKYMEKERIGGSTEDNTMVSGNVTKCTGRGA